MRTWETGRRKQTRRTDKTVTRTMAKVMKSWMMIGNEAADAGNDDGDILALEAGQGHGVLQCFFTWSFSMQVSTLIPHQWSSRGTSVTGT